MSTTTDLGHLRLSCPKSKLQLALDASITTSEVHHGTLTSQHLQQNSSDWLTSRAAWVCRGVGLRLELDLYVGGKPLDNESLESLREALCKADLWDQLRLRASLEPNYTDTDDPAPSKGLISIKLDHDRLEDVPQKSIRHMLSSGGSFADVKPPDGVEQIALEAINLKLRIDRKKPARKRRKRCPSTGPSSELGNSQEGACFESLEEAASQSSLYEDDMLLLDEPLLCTSRPEDLLWEEERQAMDISNHVVKNTPNLSKRTAAASNPDDEADGEEGESVASHQLTQLVDAALRLTICERPNKLPAGIKFKKTDLAARLSEFAPALWSPEYLPAMSQRAVFLPTIAHALSHSLYKNARSASLQSKIEMLATKCAESAEENQSAKETASQMTAPLSASSAYHAISVKLWQLLQRELFDEKAARRLKPLKILKDAVATARPDGDDLLEDLAVADRQDDMLPFAAEDQLLDWSDDDLGPHFSEDDLLFGSEPGELEEPEELEDPESLWNYTPAWPSDQASDEFVEGLLMPVPRRPARLSFTGSGFELNASPSSGSRSRAHEYLEPCVEMCELDDEQIGEWMQDGTSDGDVIMSF